MRRAIGGHHQPNYGKSDEWYTPPSVFRALGLTFDLDPASPLSAPVPWIPAARHLTVREDGLRSPWEGRVFLNPPYGKNLGPWIARLACHGNGIALLFARTDTRWFHAHAVEADLLCFVRGRLAFIPGEGQSSHHNSGGPSMLLAFGHECAHAVERSGLGACMAPLLQESSLPLLEVSA